MAYLLDTHAFLWFIAGDNKLPSNVVAKIENTEVSCYISIASFWEIAIKLQIGKLELAIDFEQLFRFAEENQIEILDINEKHLLQLLAIELHHNDPFDRVIIAQALSEKLTLISKDKKMESYKIKQEWT
ncbi:MAG: type II toxin-antitoxin system VapC family toxin [Pedobacter sp.]|uniref:type II toxin-antitoxin system VapC family toxin n=1 Tax=Pedobacter sp. TaxID=1411316 RepID=UPI00280744E9|nr:type II toxin-antitoxin system VapC family toxin [Pedobacter sp.]MDQ8005680.1 type II toxin-antitoxin system VapC family toxin [Pedobacter sp.]